MCGNKEVKLGDAGIDSKGLTGRASGVCLGVSIPKGLGQVVIESNGVAGAVAFDKVEDWSDFPEVWHAKGLEDEEQELGEGAITGRTSRGHPT